LQRLVCDQADRPASFDRSGWRDLIVIQSVDVKGPAVHVARACRAYTQGLRVLGACFRRVFSDRPRLSRVSRQMRRGASRRPGGPVTRPKRDCAL